MMIFKTCCTFPSHLVSIISMSSFKHGSVGSSGNCGWVDCTEEDVISPMVGQTFGDDDQMDLLPTYCPNKSKSILSIEWAYGIMHVGQCFGDSANKFREVLCKYAMECDFQFMYVTDDYMRITAVCKFVASMDCTWLVHVRVLA